jgi:4-amino-4-deoxy-L-arabinose transferase-like glycosyltransferase
MKKARFGVFLVLLALAVRVPMLVALRGAYLTGGITTSLGLVARNLLRGRGLVETTGPNEIIQLYDIQLGERKLRDIADFPDPPGQTFAPLIQRMPGYPALLATLWRFVGTERYLPVQILQVGLSCLLPLFLYGAGRRLFGELSGRIAGVLSCLNLAEARLAIVPLYDWWIIFFMGLILWLLSLAMKRAYPLHWFAVLGAGFAASAYFKSTVVAVPFFLSVSLIPLMGLRRAALRGALLVGLPLLSLIPWAARNERIFQRPILTNTFLWPSIWEGFGEVSNYFGAVLDDRRTYLAALGEDRWLQYASPEYDDFFREKVIRVFEGRPGFVASLWIGRFWRGLVNPGNPWGIAGADEPESSYALFHLGGRGTPMDYVRARPLVSLVKVLQRLWDPLLVSLTLVTLFVDRHRWREFLPWLSFPVAFLAVTIPIHLEGRYLLPGVLVYLLFASAPITAWLSFGRQGSSPSSAPA